MGSQRQPVPGGIFANDLYKPSVRFEEEELLQVGPSDEGAGARPATPEPNPTSETTGTQCPNPHSPDPPEKGSGARGSVSLPSDAEVMELDDE